MPNRRLIIVEPAIVLSANEKRFRNIWEYGVLGLEQVDKLIGVEGQITLPYIKGWDMGNTDDYSLWRI